MSDWPRGDSAHFELISYPSEGVTLRGVERGVTISIPKGEVHTTGFA